LCQTFLHKSTKPTISPAEGVAGNVTVKPAEVVSQKYPIPVAAVNPVVLAVVSQDTAPVGPKPVAVPLFVNDSTCGNRKGISTIA
jgi:hypothetical protein